MLEGHSAGENIASYCTKCKLNLDHTIVAMKDGGIAKVTCKTCGSTHKFKDPAAPAPIRPPRKPSTKAANAAASEWEKAVAGAISKEQAYDMAATYRIGDVVLHNRFGKGIVTRIFSNKCAMLFQDKERLMASAN